MRAVCPALLGLLFSASLSAGSLHVVVDAERLDELRVDPAFLLPDGSQQYWHEVEVACRANAGDGLVAYDPAAGTCMEFSLALPAEFSESFDMGDGVLVFDSRTRESCVPGSCIVTVDGGAPAGGDPGPGDPPDSIFADGFELLLPQS